MAHARRNAKWKRVAQSILDCRDYEPPPAFAGRRITDEETILAKAVLKLLDEVEVIGQ